MNDTITDSEGILSPDTDLKITQDFKKVKSVICLSDAAGNRVKKNKYVRNISEKTSTHTKKTRPT